MDEFRIGFALSLCKSLNSGGEEYFIPFAYFEIGTVDHYASRSTVSSNEQHGARWLCAVRQLCELYNIDKNTLGG